MFGDTGIRVTSIVIGIIFIVGLILLANRFGAQIREKLQSTRTASSTVTPTPSPFQPEETFKQIAGQTKGEADVTYPQVSQIPDTGAETLVIPTLISLFGIGLKLRKAS